MLGSKKRCSVALSFVTLTSAGCDARLDVTIHCFEPPLPYAEHFGEKGPDHYPALVDQCWQAQNLSADRRLEASEDLVLTYLRTEDVGLEDAPLTLARRMPADFVLVTHAEATERLQSSFCLHPGDAAGIVVTGPAAGDAAPHRLALLIAPDLAPPLVACVDDDDDTNDPPVIASVGETQSGDIWTHGEADIALCRSGDRLTYYYRQPDDPDADWQAKDWVTFDVPPGEGSDFIGTGPVDVGLVTTRSDDDLQVQGVFNWVYVFDVVDDCKAPLEDMIKPEAE
jgi:hypothetical protein